MTEYPNCKINLGLRVTGRRADGYHDLETVFLPVPLCDELEIEEACADQDEEVRFVAEGIVLDSTADDNLCVKAYRLLREEFGERVRKVRMRLRKNIPFGAGLGGGSSDAAFALKMLNGMFALGLDAEALKARASRLGADCAFFIDNVPAYALGIGDRLTPVTVDLKDCRLVMAKPEEGVSTREAYAGVDAGRASWQQHYDLPLTEALRLPIERWKEVVANDFEPSVFAEHPAIADIKRAMYGQGALYASMTGSGATVYGYFPKDADLGPLRDALGRQLIFCQ